MSPTHSFPNLERQFRYVRTLVMLLLLITSGKAQVLEYVTEVKLDPKELITERSFLIQVNNRDQDWLSDISIPYKEGDKIELLEAVILDGAGKELRTIGKKEITTRHNISDGSFFEDDWVREFSLKWNAYPHRVRYRYRLTTERYIYAARWYPTMYTTIPTVRAILKISYPANLPVTVFTTQKIEGDSISEKGRVFREWRYTETAPLKKEALAPPIHNRLPCIIVAPSKFMYGEPGSLSSWAAYGEWQERLNAGVNDLPLYEKQKVGQAKAKAPNQLALMKELYHYVQDNTRYINVSMDVGGLKSYPASYVSARKYGDCKALTVFMQSLLLEAGIPSFGVDVNGAINPETIHSQIPGPQFNHMILCVPMGQDTLWLENTANHIPFGYLGTFTHNRPALVINGSQSRLVRTPALSADQVRCRRTYEYTLSEDGTAKAKAAWELRGDEFEDFRAIQVNRSTSDLKEAIEEALPGKDYQLVDWNVLQEGRDSPMIRIVLNLDVANLLRSIGKTQVIRLPVIPVPELEPPDGRTTPAIVNVPVEEEQELIFHLPNLDGRIVALPKDVTLSSDFGRYTIKARNDDETVRLERQLSMPAGTVALERYPEFYRFIQLIREADRSSQILIRPKP